MADDDIRVPTVPVEVEFLLTDGARIRGTIHLSSTSPFHDGPETLDEFFNADRRFLPVRGDDGGTILVGRRAILTATVQPSAPLLSRLPGRVPEEIFFLTVHLENGATVEGTLLANLPSASSRLSDAFNRGEQFVPVETSDTVSFVHKDRIARIVI